MSGVDGRPRQVLIRNRAIRRGRCALAPPSLKSSWPSLGVRTFEAAPMYYVISRTDTKVSSTPVRRLAHLVAGIGTKNCVAMKEEICSLSGVLIG
jgi:hypothetical protein